jgi:16S rRNA (adenine1518-N6/adenine1519-N6)-dimethyltransferase
MTDGPRTLRARELLDRYGARAKKSWGQNFLEDESVRARIVAAAGVGADDVVVEIGAGLGALTGRLAAVAGQVVAVERDPEMLRVLEGELGMHPRVRIVAADAVDFDLAALAAEVGRPLVVVGNLPYQITTPLLFRVLGQAAGGRHVVRGVFMVQREVAERIAAGPGSKTYGRLSVMTRQAAEVEALFHVRPGSFFPSPSVMSTVFRLVPRGRPLAPVPDERAFAAVVRIAFGARRKMLRRALGAAVGDEEAARALAAAGVPGERRAEELSVEEFGRIAGALGALGVSLPDATGPDEGGDGA